MGSKLSVPEILRPQYDHHIKSCGQALQGVFPAVGEKGVPFIYTIGNALLGLPELLTVGPIDPQVSGHFLNELGHAMRETKQAYPDGLLIHQNYRHPFMIHKCSELAKSEYTIQVGQYLGRQDYEVLQVIVCDKNGRYPDNPDCDPHFRVPLI